MDIKASYASRFHSLLDNNKEYLMSLAKKYKEDKEDISKKERREFLKALANNETIETEDGKTIGLQEAYAQELVDNTTYGVEAQLIATDFFNMSTLEVGDPLFYTVDEPIEERASVTEISVHGGEPNESLIQDGDMVRINPYQVTSPESSMTKFNLRQGDISNEEKMRERIERGLSNEIDLDAWTLLEAGLISNIGGASSFEDINGIQIDDRVQEYPTTNDLDMNTEGAITITVVKSIVEHFDMLGKTISNIYIPSNRRSDLWDWMSAPMTYNPNSESFEAVDPQDLITDDMRTNILRTGTVNNLFGYPVNLIPLNTLNGTAGDGNVYIWVRTSSACGEFRDIPRASSVFRDEDAKRIYMTENKAIAMFQVPNQKLNYLRIRIA